MKKKEKERSGPGHGAEVDTVGFILWGTFTFTSLT